MFRRILLLFALIAISLSAQPLQGIKFCIDPGHGGHDPANDRYIPATGFWESEGNWAKANYLKPILEDLGATVIITRDGNDDADDLLLSQRAAIANAYNVDYFNSIHSNGYDGTRNSTLVLFRGYDNSPIFPVAKAVGNVLNNRIYSHHRTTNKSLRGDWSFYPSWGTSGLGVLRPLSMPGTLTEGSFHDYVPESWRLKGEAYLKHEAYAIARGLIDYFSSSGGSGKGSIAGIARDVTQNVSYFYLSGTNDAKVPLNYTYANLEDNSKTFTGDDQNNGFYLLDSLDPGQYKVYITAENYQLDSATVTVTEDNTTFVDKWLDEAPNFNPPVVLDNHPADGASDVSLKTNISIYFDISMNKTSVINALSINDSISYTYFWTENDKKLTIVPDANLSPGSTYTVSITTDAKTKFDVAIAEPFSFEFSTRSKLNLLAHYPLVDEVDVSNTLEIRLDFDAPIVMTTLPSNIGLYDVEGNTVVVVLKGELLEFGKIYFEPRNPLPANTDYFVRLKSGIGDTEGLFLGEDYEIKFTSGDWGVQPGGTLIDFENVETWWDPEQSGSTTGTSSEETTFAASTEKSYAGDKSGKLTYVFTNEAGGLCRVYNSAKPSIGNVGDESFGTWIFGDNSNNVLEYWFYENQTQNVIKHIDTLNWTGWKFKKIVKNQISASGDILFHSFVIRQTPEGTKSSVLYFDEAILEGLVGVEDETTTPEKFALNQNYPNPFNPSTTISFTLPETGDVNLSIFNVLGQRVADINKIAMPVGTHSVNWDASGLTSGVYIYRLTSGNFTQSMKMILLK